ncbi:delta(1)-pyrroline-2-carboxylate reductase family protein [Ramlibacter sp. PS3R-8]|uniref:delta(1)-pyrroline-2-carboxylate reductase family protein n=1 Tax=Ramlibacter sp. PS3R-8 TaxID=3133437 RepID=UPI0030B2D881
MTELLDAPATAARLPYDALVRELVAVLHDSVARVPPRLVQALPGGGSLFVMPAFDAQVAITKLITFTPRNVGTKTPTIQGDVVVFDIETGQRRLVLDGPTVTARRTAAVSLLAAQWLAPNTSGPLLVVGAGAQGRAHLEAFAQWGVREVLIHSRSEASAHLLATRAREMGLHAEVVGDVDAALARCPLVVTCTPAHGVVLRALPRADAFIAAVGAFTPRMIELDPVVTQHVARTGRIVVDTRDADHEAGDLLQAGIDVASLPSLRDVDPAAPRASGPVLFKSCGWAGWDLAAARTALRIQ